MAFLLSRRTPAASRLTSSSLKWMGEGLGQLWGQSRRCLALHEYQSMELMQKYGVHLPRFCPAKTVREAYSAAKHINGGDMDLVVKAQVLAGARGNGYFLENAYQGGVQICTSADQVKDVAKKMLGNTLLTRQTGPRGKPCNAILVAERFYIRREKYFAVLMDRQSGGPLLIGSRVGGVTIEEIAMKNPAAIVKQPVDISKPFTDELAEKFAEKLGFEGGEKVKAAGRCIRGLYELFIERDCTLVEVNPFAETHDGRVIVCDAKVNFDDNAEFRQKDVFEMRDESQEDEREVEAERQNLNYVGLDGNIGCMVNGAGLAMATMDIIQLQQGKPANFLDVGGGATRSQVVEALRILQKDSNVRSIFINIFGGIMRCDTIALGIIHASQEVGLTKPLVVRLEGTNQFEARQLLEESGMRTLFCSDFESAAQKSVKMAHILHLADTADLDVSFAL